MGDKTTVELSIIKEQFEAAEAIQKLVEVCEKLDNAPFTLSDNRAKLGFTD